MEHAVSNCTRGKTWVQLDERQCGGAVAHISRIPGAAGRRCHGWRRPRSTFWMTLVGRGASMWVPCDRGSAAAGPRRWVGSRSRWAGPWRVHRPLAAAAAGDTHQTGPSIAADRQDQGRIKLYGMLDLGDSGVDDRIVSAWPAPILNLVKPVFTHLYTLPSHNPPPKNPSGPASLAGLNESHGVIFARISIYSFSFFAWN